MNAPKTLRELSCADDYDPNSMPVDKARALIRQYLEPVTATERIHVRAALGRVLAEDVVSPLDVPGHDNSAMDGWAVRFDDVPRDGSATLTRVGDSFAGRPHAGEVRAGEAVRIFTGGVMPPGADTVVMQERATEVPGGVTIAAGAVAKRGQNRRFAGEDLKRGATVFGAGQALNPAELGMLASLGVNEVSVYRRLRVAFFSTGDELRAIGQPLAAGEIYDSNRYTLHGMLTRLGCDVLDMGGPLALSRLVFEFHDRDALAVLGHEHLVRSVARHRAGEFRHALRRRQVRATGLFAQSGTKHRQDHAASAQVGTDATA